VDGPYEQRNLHGLEAFFRQGAMRPPRWKMVILTWLGVFPAAFVWGQILHPLLAPLPQVLAYGVISAFILITLAWGVMPVLTRVFEGWLLGNGIKG